MIHVPTVLRELLDAVKIHGCDVPVVGPVRAEDAFIALSAALDTFEHQVGALNAEDPEPGLPTYRELWDAAIIACETAHGRALIRYTAQLEKRLIEMKRAMARTEVGEAATEAVGRLLFALHIYSPHDRGTLGCMRDAIRLLRPDIDRRLADGETPDALYEELGEESDE